MDTLFNTHSTKLLAAMPEVKSLETQLAELNKLWGKITLIGKINSHNVASTILDDMNRTQNKFGVLQQNLTDSLLRENLQKLILDNASRAQVAIDLLIRNLFERTADVGFLATDNDIRVFLNQAQSDQGQIEFIENRLGEYVKKYSVYDEIIILDTQGKIRAHLDPGNQITASTDPLIQETLASQQAYVETFRYSELQANRRHSLIYSCKITETDQKNSRILGVLCLCFRFDDEMQGIFANLVSECNNEVISILNSEGRVIASSNEQIMPLKTYSDCYETSSLARFQRIDYIVNTRRTTGYQGFYGLGWRGQMLTQLDWAFKRDLSVKEGQEYKEIIDQSDSFPQDLKVIRKASSDINADLSLLVLNGQIASARRNAAEFMPVLEAIKQIGTDISSLFTASVNSLQEVTVMSSHLNNAGFLASLAVDIMDRNLYERANDCRWWALTSLFRRNLAKSEMSDVDTREISEILSYINALYTVYTNLYVYNTQGIIVAVSNPQQLSLVGVKVNKSSGFRIDMDHANSQSYSVSSFSPTILYNDRHTYIYNAAITDLIDTDKVLGGIGLVFDSEPQFAAMLRDILPKKPDGSPMTNSFAVFTDRKGIILSVANHLHYCVGENLPIDDAYFKLKNGETRSMLIKHSGENYVLGIAASKGYREYKTKDNYHNDVIAFVFIPI
ncbi:cache domain-containing protein [Methylicorpusculum sp.]|uniref:cache domain-containing protein n=1 Tax=Methylicorpusculum sp. TaxID=2713644 RepID=UPI002722D8B3|nr:cache domain-containing protein [Methylicorpusculum sp.]MDO8843585.1 cache domain-containing protein [Methylicorpusculum sp.]MDP2178130.1 cache domain-containing protein [Methylicorpusculum sp.]MDP3529492.1 cache domain-containing protein [Methylicorpusculum sp.]